MSHIASVGHAVPARRVTSAELELQLGLEPGWIERRTGIRERRYASAEEATSDLAIAAGRRVLDSSRTPYPPIGLLLLATSTPDHLLPPTAPLVAHRLGLKHCGAIDLANACGGFLAALALGDSHCRVRKTSVLIIAANVLSKRLNRSDPNTAAIFSDAAGAMLLAPTDGPGDILAVHLDSRGEHHGSIGIPAGGSREPISAETFPDGRHWMQMERGPHLFRTAAAAMVRAGRATLASAMSTENDVDWWLPHQANLRLIRDVGGRLGFGPDRTLTSITEFGNSSAATIPLTFSLAMESGKIKPSQLILLTAAGAGLVEAGALIRWKSES